MENIRNDIFLIIGFVSSTVGKIVQEINMELINDVLYSGVLVTTIVYSIYKIKNERKKK